MGSLLPFRSESSPKLLEVTLLLCFAVYEQFPTLGCIHYVYHRGRGGGERIFSRGVLKFFEGKRWMLIFLDAIERLSICNIIDKPLHK